MADDRWLTFDCYGTIADWNTCMREALEPVVGAAAPALLTAYHLAELTLEASPELRISRYGRHDGPASKASSAWW